MHHAFAFAVSPSKNSTNSLNDAIIAADNSNNEGEDDDDEPTDATEEELISSRALVILLTVLLFVLFLGYFFQVRKIRVLHESIVSVVLGIFVGLIVSGDPHLTKNVSFKPTYFFNILLPPIILNSGYDLNMKNFFRNFGSILIFAFVGTFISTIIIGVLSFLLLITGLNGISHVTFLETCLWGAILSSTDALTVIAVFQQLKVDPGLYAIIFGESVLNDSVAIVMFNTLRDFRESSAETNAFVNFLSVLFSFVTSFTGSLLVGVLLGLGIALLLKHSRLHRYPVTETSLVSLIAYFSYVFSNSVKLSGIVSLLFCGITMKHYASHNMSIHCQRATKAIFKVLAQMSENFIFIYLGVTLFAFDHGGKFYPGLIFFVILFVLLARACSVFPLSALINRFHHPLNRHITSLRQRLRYDDSKGSSSMDIPPSPSSPNSPSINTNQELIPQHHQKMIWWAGLRGAIAFALSSELVPYGHLSEDEKNAGNYQVMQAFKSTTLVVCVISVVFLGGGTPFVLKYLGIKMGNAPTMGMQYGNTNANDTDGSGLDDMSDGVGELDVEVDAAGFGEDFDVHVISPLDDGSANHGSQVNGGNLNNRDWDHWWIGFDNRYLRPIFTKTKWRWGERVTAQSSVQQTGLLQQHQQNQQQHQVDATPIFATDVWNDHVTTAISNPASPNYSRAGSPSHNTSHAHSQRYSRSKSTNASATTSGNASPSIVTKRLNSNNGSSSSGTVFPKPYENEEHLGSGNTGVNSQDLEDQESGKKRVGTGRRRKGSDVKMDDF